MKRFGIESRWIIAGAVTLAGGTAPIAVGACSLESMYMTQASPLPWPNEWLWPEPAPTPASRVDAPRFATTVLPRALVSSAAIAGLDSSMTLCDLLAHIGPPMRDGGSGLYIWEWDIDDGRTLIVSAADPDRPPVGWRLGRGR